MNQLPFLLSCFIPGNGCPFPWKIAGCVPDYGFNFAFDVIGGSLWSTRATYDALSTSLATEQTLFPLLSPSPWPHWDRTPQASDSQLPHQLRPELPCCCLNPRSHCITWLHDPNHTIVPCLSIPTVRHSPAARRPRRCLRSSAGHRLAGTQGPRAAGGAPTGRDGTRHAEEAVGDVREVAEAHRDQLSRRADDAAADVGLNHAGQFKPTPTRTESQLGWQFVGLAGPSQP